MHLQPGPSAVRKVSQPAAPKIRSPHRHRRVLSQEGMVGWEGPGASGGHVESVSLCSDLVWELEGCGLFEAATGAIFRP